MPASKRAFDIAVAATALVILAPVLAAVAIAVRLESRGPILFAQQRVGRNGRPFRILKFRTMVVGAEGLGPNVTATEDVRVTRVGRVLRRCFLDESPQLVNVLRGDMSLVGPRPETPEYAALLSGDECRILSVRPGMAGPSTLAYSAREADLLAAQEDPDRFYREHLLHARIRADLGYLERAGLREDVRVLAKTSALVASGLGIRWSSRSAPRRP